MSALKVRLFVAFAVLAALVCVRLGIWQLHRLGERRARNALIAGRMNGGAADARAVWGDTAAAHYRRIRVTGVPDYAHELVYAARTYKGSPGVNLLTPMRIAGTDTGIIVDRGWVYAPDGARVDLAKWHDRDSTFEGYAEVLPPGHGSSYVAQPSIIARLSDSVVAARLPYPIAPIYLVALGDTARSANEVARLRPPPLDEGPHFSYAIQWFGFALISVVGAGFVVKQARQSQPRAPAIVSSSGGGEAD